MFDLSSSQRAESMKSFLGVQVWLMILEYIDGFLELKCIKSGVLVVAFPTIEFFEKDASAHFVETVLVNF